MAIPQNPFKMPALASVCCLGAALLGIPASSQAQTSARADVTNERSDSAPERLVVRYRDGTISAAELDAWQSYLKRNGRPVDRDFAVKNLVLVRVLAGRFDGGPGGERASDAERAGLQAQREYRARQAANARLVKVLGEAAVPTAAAVRGEFDADPTRYQRPKRWRLSNIFLRLPSESPPGIRKTDAREAGARGADARETDTRKKLRQRLETLRVQILSGADFAELARAESQSETRLRGGDLGFVSLERLHPAVARAVSRLTVDGLSEVIDTEDGVTLLRCTAMLEPKSQRFTEVRTRVESRLREQRFARLQSELDHELLEGLKPLLPGAALPPVAASENGGASGNGGASVAARYRLDGEDRTLTTAALTRFLRLQGVGKSVEALTGEQRADLVQQRLLHEARAQEARRRGLLDDSAYHDALGFHDLEIRAQLVANRSSERQAREPSDEAIEAFYDQHRDNFVAPKAQRLRAIVVARDPGYGAGFFRHLRGSAEQLATTTVGTEPSAEAGTLDSLAQALGARAELRDYGWLSDQQVWQLGLNIDAAVASLKVGRFSPLVQQNNFLYILELVAKRPPHKLSRDEARPRIRAKLLATARRRIGDALRVQVLAEQQIERVEASQ